MAKYIKLTHAQKDEIRRLTQLTNRRIKNAHKAYSKEGMDILPRDVVGDHQIKEKWHTKNTPLSRSTKFTSKKEYRRHLNYLRGFENMRPGIKEYSQIQREKTLQAVESSTGLVPTKTLEDKINKMNAPQLSKFWNTFSNKASKLGIKYSSNQAMQQTLNEIFPEDRKNIA